MFSVKMVKEKVKYNIISVPSTKKYIDYPADFPRLGRLYLELLENKDKIKEELKNTEYIPKQPAEDIEDYIEKKKVKETTSNDDDKEKEKSTEYDLDKSISLPQDRLDEKLEKYTKDIDYFKNGNRDNRDDIIEKYSKKDKDYSDFSDYSGYSDYQDHSDYSDYSDSKKAGNSRNLNHREKYRNSDRKHRGHKKRYPDSYSDYSDNYSESEYSRSRSDSNHSDSRSYTDSDSEGSGEKDRLSKKLFNLLEEKTTHEKRDRFENNHRQNVNTQDKYSKPRNNHPEQPSLAQLENAGQYTGDKHLPNYTYATTDKDQDERKREILFKFDILRKSYKNKDIPEYTIHSSLDSMEKGYETTLKNLSIDSTVDNYRRYLTIGFVGVEFAMCTLFKFDMTGFTQQQLLSMESYERILIEIGEKSYSPNGSSLPAEIRLLFLLLMNSAMFILGKMLSNKTGVNPISMFSQSSKPSMGKQKRKMKGPNVDIDDL